MVATGHFLLQGYLTVQTAHCALHSEDRFCTVKRPFVMIGNSMSVVLVLMVLVFVFLVLTQVLPAKKHQRHLMMLSAPKNIKRCPSSSTQQYPATSIKVQNLKLICNMNSVQPKATLYGPIHNSKLPTAEKLCWLNIIYCSAANCVPISCILFHLCSKIKWKPKSLPP